MLLVNSVSWLVSPVTPVCQRLPKPLVLSVVTLSSAWIASKVTSDYRIRGAIVLGVVVLCLLSKKIQGYVKRYFHKPPPQNPQINTSYLGLFGSDHLNMLARYVDRPLRDQIKNDQTPDIWWQVALTNTFLRNLVKSMKKKPARLCCQWVSAWIQPWGQHPPSFCSAIKLYYPRTRLFSKIGKPFVLKTLHSISQDLHLLLKVLLS